MPRRKNSKKLITLVREHRFLQLAEKFMVSCHVGCRNAFVSSRCLLVGKYDTTNYPDHATPFLPLTFCHSSLSLDVFTFFRLANRFNREWELSLANYD